jgi:hypothetical protein
MKNLATWSLGLTVALLGSQAAFAQATAPAKSRDQVQQECVDARKAGKVQDGECARETPMDTRSSTTTREAVRKDCIEARKAGKIEDGECKPDKASVRSNSTAQRAPVKKEAEQSRKAGKTVDGEATKP